MLASLWGKWALGANRRPSASRRGRPARPRVELLEDRCVPSTTVAEFPVLTAGGSPVGIAAGPDGNLWFTENAANQIGMINPTTHAITEFPIPTADSGPVGDHGGARRQPLVHRERRQPDRQ